jgi:hypothetical protein
MCCNGVLYNQAKVAPGEEPRMLAAGLEIFDEGDRRFFRQPCPQSSCGRCMIYDNRFEICHTFECALLRRVKAGELSVAEGQSKIATAQQLLSKVVAADPEARAAGGRVEIRARLAEEVRNNSGAERKRNSQNLLDIVAIDTFLERWFRHKPEKRQADQAMREMAKP